MPLEIKGVEIKDIAGVSTPLTKLLDMVGSATCILFEPVRIQRRAAAEAAALLLATNAEIEADALRSTAARRFVQEQMRKQQNLESIMAKAVPELERACGVADAADSDWLTRFLLEAQDVSDETLQELWARLLAGEISTPGSYSRRVLRILKELDPPDAKVIAEVGSKLLRVENHDGSVEPILVTWIADQWNGGRDHGVHERYRSPEQEFRILQELNLIESDEQWWEFSVEGGILDMHLSHLSARRLFNEAGSIAAAHEQLAMAKEEGPRVVGGQPVINLWVKTARVYGYKVTRAGEQLFKLSSAKSSSEYLDQVRTGIADTGLALK